MHLITTLFLELAIILPFIFHLCTGATEPANLDALVDIRSSESFRRQCHQLVGSGMGSRRALWGFIAQECLLFCGFRKIGLLDRRADLDMKFIKDLLAKRKDTRSDVYERIKGCVTGGDRNHVCVKAMRNAYCVMDYLGDDWFEINLKKIMESSY